MNPIFMFLVARFFEWFDPGYWLRWFWNNIVMLPFQLISELLNIGIQSYYYNLLVRLPLITEYPAVYSLFEMMRNIAFGFFSLILLVAGICYLLESFHVVKEGEAFNILNNSIFTIILIFTIIPIYEAVAGLFNGLTNYIITYPVTVGGTVYSTNAVDAMAVNAARGGVQPVTFLIMFSVFIGAFMIGVGRLLLLMTIVVLLPLLLVLRLVPLIKQIADRMLNDFVGLIIASLFTAIVLEAGTAIWATWGWGGNPAEGMFCSSVLMAAAFMPAMLASSFGTFSHAAQMIGSQVASTTSQMAMAGASAATGGMMGAAGGAIGAVSGGAGGAMGQATTGGAGGLRGALNVLSHTIGPAAMEGLKGGAMEGLAGRGKPTTPFKAAIKGYGAGKGAALNSAESLSRGNLSTLSDYYEGEATGGEKSGAVTPDQSSSKGRAGAMNILGLNDEDAGRFTQQMMDPKGMTGEREDYENWGRWLKGRFQEHQRTGDYRKSYRLLGNLREKYSPADLMTPENSGLLHETRNVEMQHAVGWSKQAPLQGAMQMPQPVAARISIPCSSPAVETQVQALPTDVQQRVVSTILPQEQVMGVNELPDRYVINYVTPAPSPAAQPRMRQKEIIKTVDTVTHKTLDEVQHFVNSL